MSERCSRQTSRPQSYKEFDRTEAMENQSGETEDLMLQAPGRDSDIDGPQTKSAKKSKKKTEPTRERSSSRAKNPSVSQIPSGTVSSTIRNIQSNNQDDLELIPEVHNTQQHSNTEFQIAQSASGACVLHLNTQNAELREALDRDQINSAAEKPDNSNVRALGAQTTSANSSNNAMAISANRHTDDLSLPQPTWRTRDNKGRMYQYILANQLSLEGLSDDQLAALSEQEYQ